MTIQPKPMMASAARKSTPQAHVIVARMRSLYGNQIWASGRIRLKIGGNGLFWSDNPAGAGLQ
jgi:hypothetical protein